MITEETVYTHPRTAERADSGVGTSVATADIDVAIGGMTCASGFARVERTLAKVPGVVEASVNLATEKAHVRYDPTAVAPPRLVGAIEAAGYTARPLAAAPSPAAPSPATPDAGAARQELVIAGMTCASCVARVERKLVRRPASPRRRSTWRPSARP